MMTHCYVWLQVLVETGTLAHDPSDSHIQVFFSDSWITSYSDGYHGIFVKRFVHLWETIVRIKTVTTGELIPDQHVQGWGCGYLKEVATLLLHIKRPLSRLQESR